MKPEQILEIQRASFKRLSEGKDHGVEWRIAGDTTWRPCAAHENGSVKSVFDAREYRIRPDTVNVFGLDLPAHNEDAKGSFLRFHDREFTFRTVEHRDEWLRFMADCLSEKYAAPKLPEPFREHPEVGQKYFNVYGNGRIYAHTWEGTDYEILYFKASNCYRTESDAQQWNEYLTAIRKGGPRPVVGPRYSMTIITDKGTKTIRDEPQKLQIDRDALWNKLHDKLPGASPQFCYKVAEEVIEHLNAEPVTQEVKELVIPTQVFCGLAKYSDEAVTYISRAFYQENANILKERGLLMPKELT